MSSSQASNRVKAFRQHRNWTQSELAERSGISRAAVSAIEGGRLVPSVQTGLALARVFGSSVEELFGVPAVEIAGPQWAWAPPGVPWRCWQAEVSGRLLLFPVERTGEASLPHDGVCGDSTDLSRISPLASQTLVLACCDPAAALMAAEYQRHTGMRLVVITRSSRRALELLRQGAVHMAGLHFATPAHREGNEKLVREQLGEGYCLVRAAGWQEGIAVAGGVHARSVDGIRRTRLRWVGREVGSAARQCLDELLTSRRPFRHIASDHRGVVDSIRSGWADAGVCVRLVSEEAGLRFLNIQQETYDLCFPSALQNDPRIRALVAMLRSSAYRKLIGELPGYDTQDVGELRPVI